MAENQILVKFKPTGQRALTNAINQLHLSQVKLEKGQKAYEKALRKTNHQQGLFSTKSKRLAQTNGVLANSFATIRSKMLLASFAMSMGIRQIIDLTKHTAKVTRMRVAFDNLAESANLGEGTLKKLREATDGTMDDFKLLEQANNALLLGVAKSSDQMARMFDVAQRLGRALGKDTAHSVESLITGIGRQSRLMLDNIGIIVKSEEAYDAYAAQLGTTSEKLTDAQKKTAFLTAAMDAAERKVKSLGKEVINNQDGFEILGTSISNAFEVLTKSEFIQFLAKGWGEIVADAFGQVEEVENYTKEIRDLQGELSGLEFRMKSLQEVREMGVSTENDYLEMMVKQIDGIDRQEQALGRLVKWIETAKLQHGFLSDEIEKQIELYLSGATAIDTFSESSANASINIDLLTKEINSNLGEIEKVIATLEDFIRQMELMGVQAAKSGFSIGKSYDNMGKAVNAALSDVIEKQIQLMVAELMKDAISKAGWFGIPLAASAGAVVGSLVGQISRNWKFEQGGLVGGRRHSQGGTMIEAERGEFAMSRNAVDAIGVENLNRMNQGGGGAVNVTFSGNVMSQEFIENEAIPQIKDAIRRGADIGVS